MRGEAKLSDRMFYLLTIGILLASAFFYLCQSFRIMSLKWEIFGLKSQYQSVARRGDGLKVKLATLNDLPRLERRAIGRGFAHPRPSEMLLLQREDLSDGMGGAAADER